MSWIVSACLALFGTAADADRPTVLVVVGTPGTPEYGVTFQSWIARWRDTAAQAGANFVLIGGPPSASTPRNSRPRSPTTTGCATFSPTV